jgi:hypothetical protein
MGFFNLLCGFYVFGYDFISLLLLFCFEKGRVSPSQARPSSLAFDVSMLFFFRCEVSSRVASWQSFRVGYFFRFLIASAFVIVFIFVVVVVVVVVAVAAVAVVSPVSVLQSRR